MVVPAVLPPPAAPLHAPSAQDGRATALRDLIDTGPASPRSPLLRLAGASRLYRAPSSPPSPGIAGTTSPVGPPFEDEEAEEEDDELDRRLGSRATPLLPDRGHAQETSVPAHGAI